MFKNTTLLSIISLLIFIVYVLENNTLIKQFDLYLIKSKEKKNVSTHHTCFDNGSDHQWLEKPVNKRDKYENCNEMRPQLF